MKHGNLGKSSLVKIKISVFYFRFAVSKVWKKRSQTSKLDWIEATALQISRFHLRANFIAIV